MNFDTAVEKVFDHEGDYSDHPDDKGGATRYGITEAVARSVGYRGDMRELPLDLAKRIYLDRYWRSISADDLPPGLRYIVFDAAVNSGPRQAVLWLQRALGVAADGIIGPKTLAAAYQADLSRLKSALLAQRLRFMSSLSNWPAFSRGWARRIADLMEA
jgi:lysozyme family protein